MRDPEFAHRLTHAAPPGPSPMLRARVLDAVTEELRCPLPGIDRLLARRWPWATAALVLLGLTLAIRAQEQRSDERALPRRPVPTSDCRDDATLSDLVVVFREPRMEPWLCVSLGRGRPSRAFSSRGAREWVDSLTQFDFRTQVDSPTQGVPR